MIWKDIDLEKPQCDFDVIVAVDDDVFIAGYREMHDGNYYFTDENLNQIDGVTHWMDKPDPPE